MKLSFYSSEQDIIDLENKTKRKDRLFGIFMSSLGTASILFATYPIISWFLVNDSLKINKADKAPIPMTQVLSSTDINKDIQVLEGEDGFSYFSTSYTPEENRPKEFYLDIPKFKIKNALVKVDTVVFYENLSHFPGAPLPGQEGNVFITGHSELPQFFDAKNYKSIFSKIPELEVGDVINVNLENYSFKYVVQYKKVVDPKDLSVLQPISKNGKNLTLMTCVPPGTNFKRLIVVSSLI